MQARETHTLSQLSAFGVHWYLNADGQNGKRTIVPDPKLAPIIRRMLEKYATGKFCLKQIAQIARTDGLAYRKSGAAVPKSTVHKILRNRIYSGDFDFDGVRYSGSYEPIVSRELWEQVQAILDGRGAKKTRKMRELFAFSGLINGEPSLPRKVDRLFGYRSARKSSGNDPDHGRSGRPYGRRPKF
jgi:hypothetical protein